MNSTNKMRNKGEKEMYYCKHCKEVCKKEEVEVVEGYEEGDWIEIHTKCNEEVNFC